MVVTLYHLISVIEKFYFTTSFTHTKRRMPDPALLFYLLLKQPHPRCVTQRRTMNFCLHEFLQVLNVLVSLSLFRRDCLCVCLSVCIYLSVCLYFSLSFSLSPSQFPSIQSAYIEGFLSCIRARNFLILLYDTIYCVVSKQQLVRPILCTEIKVEFSRIPL